MTFRGNMPKEKPGAANDVRVQEIIFRAVDDVNRMLPPQRRLDKSPSTVLSDSLNGGGLDSLGMVNLIVAIEQYVVEELGVTVSLADSLVITAEENPFRDIASLTVALAGIIQGIMKD